MGREMKKINYVMALSVMLVLTTVCGLNPVIAEPYVDEFQMAMLFPEKSKSENLEDKYDVFIYRGVKDKDVERFLDTQFDRIEHAMFTGTIITDKNGIPMRDKKTGEILKEDGDC